MTCKSIVLSLLLLSGFVYLSAQTQNNKPSFSYLIGKGKSDATFTKAQVEECERMITSVAARQSSAAIGNPYSMFAIVPSLSFVEERIAEGMKKMSAVKLNLNLSVVNLISNTTLGAFDVSFTGSGSNKSEAINRGIQQLRNKPNQISKAVEDFNEKINAYYENNCDKILTEAKEFNNRKNYPAAVALLHGVPPGLTCSAKTEALKNESFSILQQQICTNVNTKAQAAVASNDFISALNLLSQIDAAAPCATEAKTQISAIEAKFDATQREQWEWLFKFWSAGAEAERARWNAYTAIAMGWLRSTATVPLSN
jgi:hypothetical protein